MGAASQPIRSRGKRRAAQWEDGHRACIAAEHLLSGKTATVHYCCGDGDLAR